MTLRSQKALNTLFIAPLLLAAPMLLGNRGCEEPVPVGGCVESDCGPAPGAPAITCWDGSIGGNTGVCQAAENACQWEFRECPPQPECTAAECGVPPLSPLDTVCGRDDDGICRWIIDEPNACGLGDCGPAPGQPSWTCADGTVGGFTGLCERNERNECAWVFNDCPATGECTIEECGPAPGSPAIICGDGSEGGNTGRCLRNAETNACGWEYRECPTVN